MTKFFQTVFQVQEPIFSSGLARLEKATGNGGIDTRLIADIIEKSHQIMRQLGLDVRDTTGHELYNSLKNAVKNGDIEPLLQDADYVLTITDGKIVSFNLIDVINNFHHELSFDKQTYSHGQRSLRGELVGRYLDHARSDNVTTKDIALSMGLLPEADKCYNNLKHKHKKPIIISKEPLA